MLSLYLLAAVISFAAQCTAESSASTVPVYMWSSKSYFGGHKQASSVMQHSDFQKSLAGLTAGKIEEAPKAVVALVYSKPGAPSESIKNAASGAQSSMVVPYLNLAGSPASKDIIAAFTDHSVVNLGNDCDATLKQVKSTGLTLIKAQAPSADVDACFLRAVAQVNAQTQGSSVAIVTSDAAVPIQRQFQTESVSSTVSTQAYAATPIGPQYISSPILFGLLLSFFIIFGLLVGFSCLMSIERPVRWAGAPLAIAKEY